MKHLNIRFVIENIKKNILFLFILSAETLVSISDFYIPFLVETSQKGPHSHPHLLYAVLKGTYANRSKLNTT